MASRNIRESISTRASFAKEVIWGKRWWGWRVMFGIWFGITIFDTVQAQFIPEQNTPPTIVGMIAQYMPNWPLWLWGLIGLGILIGAILEGAYRKNRSIQKQSGGIRQLKLDVGRFLLNGKEILADLEKKYAESDWSGDWSGVVSSRLKCEMWYKDASKTFQSTDYDRLWFENKEGLNYKTANNSDYVASVKQGLVRLEYIKRVIFDKEGSQT